jgi:hypothetical protein
MEHKTIMVIMEASKMMNPKTKKKIPRYNVPTPNKGDGSGKFTVEP